METLEALTKVVLGNVSSLSFYYLNENCKYYVQLAKKTLISLLMFLRKILNNHSQSGKTETNQE